MFLVHFPECVCVLSIFLKILSSKKWSWMGAGGRSNSGIKCDFLWEAYLSNTTLLYHLQASQEWSRLWKMSFHLKEFIFSLLQKSLLWVLQCKEQEVEVTCSNFLKNDWQHWLPHLGPALWIYSVSPVETCWCLLGSWQHIVRLQEEGFKQKSLNDVKFSLYLHVRFACIRH